MTALPMVLMSDEEVAGFGQRKDQGFGALRTERGLLPLVAMSVRARVAGIVASTELAQTFVNTTGVAIEATYIFPLPDRAAVHRFRMEVAGRVVEGVVEERGAAREQYDQAIARGQRAAITEEDRAGVFSLRVGNLMPGESATVTLSLVGPLPVDDGEITFQFPLVVAPRYIPGAALEGAQAGLGVATDTDLVPDASRISPPVLLPGCPNPVRLALSVALEDHAVRDLASSLHAVTQTNQDARVVDVQPGERLDRDFILRWRIDPDAPTLKSSLVCADDTDGSGGTFMLTLVPPSTTTVAAKPREVVFVIDRSGSMEGWKMIAARRAAARMIDTLTSRDRFCVIAFDDVCELVPQEGLVAATDRNRYRAVEALAKLEARGGTELHAPMMQAVSLLAAGHDQHEQVIVLVTDGQVGNEDQILRELAPRLKKTRMFSLGIDQAVNAAFLRRLAGAGGGLCELVESEDRLDAVMAKVHRRIGTPIATELALRPTNLAIDPAQTAPTKLPDVYAGAPVTILGRYRGRAPADAAIEIACTSMGDPLQSRIARAPLPGGPRGLAAREHDGAGTPWLPASWARARIRDLEDRYAVDQTSSLEREIVSVSKQYRVLSRFTAFLAVDSEVVNKGGTVKQVVQPVETPAGWESNAAPVTKMPPSTGHRMMNAPAMPMPASAPMPAFPGSPPPIVGSAMPLGGLAGGGGGGAGAGYGSPRGGIMKLDESDSFGGDDEPAPEAPAELALLTEEEEAPDKGKRAEQPARRALRSPTATKKGAKMSPPKPMIVAKAPAAPSRGRVDAEEKSIGEPAKPAASAYLVSLATLARELDAQARGAASVAAIRLLRQRLTEWVEDIRSVGGHDALAANVERLVKRLSTALAGDAAQLAIEAQAIAGELAALAASTPPSGGAKPTRAAFWK